MSKRSSVKHKLDRRMGENIWGRPKSPVNSREYGPGQHGQRRKGFAARQFVNHGHVKVNGQRVNIPSYRCKVGDVIEVREKSKQMALVLEATQLAERDVPDYVDADHNKMTATFARVPALADVPYPVVMEPNLVVEFYSR